MAACSTWGAHWLGDPSLWGPLRLLMAERWAPAPAALENPEHAAAAANDRLGLVALAGLVAQGPVPKGTGLICSLSMASQEGLIACASPCRAARHYGLAGPWILPSPGVVGGIHLIARAQESLSDLMPRAICLAVGQNGRLAGGEEACGGAAALGLRAGQGQGSATLGRVLAGTYAGPPDSGAQADFLEGLGRQARVRGGPSIAAVVLNQPRDVKWQASLDAAARRAAPRARRYMLPVDRAGQAGGLMLILAALYLETPLPESPRLVLAGDDSGRAAALMVWAA